MKTIKIRDHEIKIFSSAKDLPIGRYSDFQKHLSGAVGFDSIESSINKAKAFIQEDKNEFAISEIDNALLSLDSVNDGIGIYTLAFAVLVAEIDLKPANDTTIDGLQLVINQLTEIGVTQYDIENSIEDVKKK